MLGSLNKAATNMVPLISHSLRALEKKENPYKTNMRQLKSFRGSFMKKEQDVRTLMNRSLQNL